MNWLAQDTFRRGDELQEIEIETYSIRNNPERLKQVRCIAK